MTWWLPDTEEIAQKRLAKAKRIARGLAGPTQPQTKEEIRLAMGGSEVPSQQKSTFSEKLSHLGQNQQMDESSSPTT